MIPKLITNLPALYNYPGCWRFLEEKGKALYGLKFRLYPEDAEVIARLLVWALQDPEGAQAMNIDLRKGVIIAGPVGCGKTSLMHLLRHFLPPAHRHRIKPCREIAYEFATEGYPVVSKYSKQSFHPAYIAADEEKPIAFCFDDLGLEPPTVQYFGNPCNPMAELLLSRYDYFISHHMLTHITTNLNSQEIEHRYGLRVRSRIREICNLVSFGNNSADKRL